MTANGDGVSLGSDKKIFWNQVVVMIVQFCKYALKKTPLNCTHFSFATPRGSWDPSSPTRDLNPRPQQLKCRIPTTGQTGNSLYTFFFFFCSTRSLLQCVGSSWSVRSLFPDQGLNPHPLHQKADSQPHWEILPCLL